MKYKKKIIWIDVGTHFAQEYNSIFGTNISFFTHIVKRYIGGNIFGRGSSINISGLKDIIQTRIQIKKKQHFFYTIFVEANHNIAREKNFYPFADLFFNLAIAENNKKSNSIIKLYLGDGEIYSQGSTIFKNKNGINKDKFVLTSSVSANAFFREIEIFLNEQFKNYVVLLRLNCEGVEDHVIYSAHKHFQKKLKLICGSLKDVRDIKGQHAFQKLEKYIANNRISFVNFASHINSWRESHKEILNLLNKL